MDSKYNVKFYNSIKKILKGPMKLVFNAEVNGLDNLPDRPYILAGNHKTMFDVVLLITNIPNEIHFMSKKELFKYKILSDIFSKMGAFPVARDKVDVKAIKDAFRVLKNNEVLGIFPEGTRNNTDKLILPFKEGVTTIATKTNSLIVPFGIGGKYKRGKLKLNIGEPINIKEIEKEKQTDYLEEKVKELILKKY
ncbi:MAG: 1-acyl-sn-glycerol-3-phosphate acyltransferase [Bacilli bacterium]|nr:1-acyl-sn-glycerol-3-phosphate acyltransferase [Bacilli bacterium]